MPVPTSFLLSIPSGLAGDDAFQQGLMKDTLKTGFNDRLQAQAEARKAMLAKFKPKPTVRPDEFVDTRSERERELEAVRRARAEAKEAARLAAIEAEEARRVALLNDEEAQLALARSARKERKAQMKAEARAKREASAAVRKSRQGNWADA